MNTSKKLEALYEKNGESTEVVSHSGFWKFKIKSSEGWLSIKDGDDVWKTRWTSGKNKHFPLKHGNSFAIHFNKEDGKRADKSHRSYGLTGAFETALSLNPVRDQDRANLLTDRMVQLIDKAHAEYFSDDDQAPKEISSNLD